MIFGVIVEITVGMLCVVLGLLIWKKQQITLLHDYHYKNVKKEDIPAYTKKMGIGLIITGIGIILTGRLNLAYSSFWWIPLLIGFMSGLIVIYVAQKKYNGSVISR